MKHGLLPLSSGVPVAGRLTTAVSALLLFFLVGITTSAHAAEAFCSIQANLTSVAATCFGGTNGTASAAPTGGTQPYSIVWSTGATSTSISNLSPGIYTCTITDAAACTVSTSVYVGQATAIQANVVRQNNACRFDTNGSLSLNPTGGTAPYTYRWSTGATTSSISGLAAGPYSYTITDSRGCTRSGSVSVLANTPIVAHPTVGNVQCYGAAQGSATLQPTGGVAPYTYRWSTGATTASVSGLLAGTHSYTVTDAVGCTTTGNIGVQQPAPVWTTFTQKYACFGNNDGFAEIQAYGGTPPYTYQWSNGATTPRIEGLAPAMYFYTVTDSRGCQSTTGLVCIFNSIVEATATAATSTCAGGADGSAAIIVTEGLPPLTYTWSNGATTANVNNLTAGVYGYTVTDAGGCSVNGAVSVANGATVTATAVLLANGNVQASGLGGVAPYTYRWSNNQTTAVATGYAAGSTYRVTVTDAVGCFGIATGQVPVQPDPCVNTIVTATATVLANGNIQASGAGGTAPYTYRWSNNQTTATATGYAPGSMYGVTVTDINGCFGVTAGQLPTLPIDNCDNLTYPGRIGVDQYLCAPGNAPMTIGQLEPATGGSGQIEYLWMYNTTGGQFNNSLYNPVPNSNTPTYSPGPLEATTYFIRCVRRVGCPFIESNTVVVTVGDEIDATIIRPTMGCAFQTQTYSVGNVVGNEQVSWAFDGPATASSNTGHTTNVTFTGAGYVNVTVTVTVDGCTGVFTERVVVGSCFQNNETATSFEAQSTTRLYPNPVQDWASLDLGQEQTTAGEVRVFNAANHLVAMYPVAIGSRQMDIDMSALPAGLYFVQHVGDNAQRKALKVIKH